MIKKSAMIAIVGRPNVGKSTLTNALVGDKVAIVSDKPQTTRTRICGVLNHGDTQLVLVDTPGLHKPRSRLGETMVKAARDSIAEVDAAMLLVEPIPHVGLPEEALLERIREVGLPAVLVVNKIDTVKKPELLKVIEAYRNAYEFDSVVPVSAKTGDGLPELLSELLPYASEGPQLFPDGMTSDQPERQVMGELLREKLLTCLDREVPHGTAVEVTRFSERGDGLIDLEAVIYCEKASHKGIIIGKDGAMLKKVASLAREDMERFMGTRIFLQTWVKVRENWRDNGNQIRNFGYGGR